MHYEALARVLILLSLAATGDRIGSDTARSSILARITGSEHRHGGRPVVELFEAPGNS